MCGLCGYNVSPAYAGKYLTEEKVKDIVREGVRLNLHRGGDAAGFMASYNEPVPFKKDETTNLIYYKAAGPGNESIVKLVDEWGLYVPNVMGIHTRAATGASPSDNENNHPVIWDDVLVTHNGHISNHAALKGSKKPKHGVVPAVDTAAISLVLNSVVDFDTNYEDIKKALWSLNGGAAIHAIHRQYPGLSLFAKTRHSPFVFAYKDDAFVYASENACIERIIDIMGDKKGWAYPDGRSLAEDKAIMVRDGNVTWFDDFNGWTKKRKMKSFRYRENNEVAFTTDDDEYVGNVDEGIYSAMPFVDKEGKFLQTHHKGQWVGHELMTAADNLRYREMFYEKENLRQFFVPWSEADEIYVLPKVGAVYGTIISVWYGKTEIIARQEGADWPKVLDVYSWENEWIRIERYENNPRQKPEFKQWVLLNSSPMSALVKKAPMPNQPALMPPNSPKRESIGVPEAAHNMSYRFDKVMAFQTDFTCTMHNKKLSEHRSKAELQCPVLIQEAIFTIDRFESLTAMLAAYTDKIHVETIYSGEGCKQGHLWELSDCIEVTYKNPLNAVFKVLVPFEDTCKECAAIRFLSSCPKWMRALLHKNGHTVPVMTRTEYQHIIEYSKPKELMV